jgi:hypothetical protein
MHRIVVMRVPEITKKGWSYENSKDFGDIMSIIYDILIG